MRPGGQNTVRGSPIGAGPAGEPPRATSAARVTVPYFCHQGTRPSYRWPRPRRRPAGSGRLGASSPSGQAGQIVKSHRESRRVVRRGPSCLTGRRPSDFPGFSAAGR